MCPLYGCRTRLCKGADDFNRFTPGPNPDFEHKRTHSRLQHGDSERNCRFYSQCSHCSTVAEYEEEKLRKANWFLFFTRRLIEPDFIVLEIESLSAKPL